MNNPSSASSRLFALIQILILACIPGCPGANKLGADELTDQENRGKQIFQLGTSSAEVEITALMGDEGIEVPASALPCSSCHGHDGRGRPEGGVSPSNLTWESLTKPYGVRHESGREHPPYQVKDLKKAIAMGFDPGGNKLNIAMPKYRMTIEDMNALIAYIQRLGQDHDPGVDAEHLRVGTVLPAAGSAGGASDAVAALLNAYFADLNARGGLYGRQVELVIARTSSSEATPDMALRSLIEREKIFALVAPMISGHEQAVAELASERGLPLVGPFALFPQLEFPLKREIFYLLSGLSIQGQALVDFAENGSSSEDSHPSAALLYSVEGELKAVADTIATHADRAGWRRFERHALSPSSTDLEGLVRDLAERRVETVFLFGPGSLATVFFSAADTAGWTPKVYASGAQLARQAFAAPSAFDGRIFLAFPSLPGDARPQGLSLYGRLAEAHSLSEAHFAVQLSTLASAELLAEGLKQAGRDLSREGLIRALEALFDHPNGLTPPLSYGPNRRVGAQGAYVVTLDLASGNFKSASEWIEVR